MSESHTANGRNSFWKDIAVKKNIKIDNPTQKFNPQQNLAIPEKFLPFKNMFQSSDSKKIIQKSRQRSLTNKASKQSLQLSRISAKKSQKKDQLENKSFNQANHHQSSEINESEILKQSQLNNQFTQSFQNTLNQFKDSPSNGKKDSNYFYQEQINALKHEFQEFKKEILSNLQIEKQLIKLFAQEIRRKINEELIFYEKSQQAARKQIIQKHVLTPVSKQIGIQYEDIFCVDGHDIGDRCESIEQKLNSIPNSLNQKDEILEQPITMSFASNTLQTKRSGFLRQNKHERSVSNEIRPRVQLNNESKFRFLSKQQMKMDAEININQHLTQKMKGSSCINRLQRFKNTIQRLKNQMNGLQNAPHQ